MFALSDLSCHHGGHWRHATLVIRCWIFAWFIRMLCREKIGICFLRVYVSADARTCIIFQYGWISCSFGDDGDGHNSARQGLSISHLFPECQKWTLFIGTLCAILLSSLEVWIIYKSRWVHAYSGDVNCSTVVLSLFTFHHLGLLKWWSLFSSWVWAALFPFDTLKCYTNLSLRKWTRFIG